MTCWVAGVDQHNHLGWGWHCQCLLKPIQVWLPGLLLTATVHHTVTAARHLQRHQVIEVIRDKKDSCIARVQQSEDKIGEALIGATGHHHIMLHNRTGCNHIASVAT